MSRIETIAEGVTLHLGDCRNVLPALGRMESIVTDPPYGIGFASQPTRYQRANGMVRKSWEIACKRIAEATRQHDLFVEKPEPKQLAWDDMWKRQLAETNPEYSEQ